MARVIKFRGQDVNGFWHYGYFSKDYLGICYITTLDGIDTTVVVESTIGQFTGFKDKKRIDVFEDDIVTAWSAGSSGTFTVKWRQEASPCWLLYPNWQERQHWNIAVSEYKIGKKLLSVDGSVYKCTTDGFFDEGLEVIGNIHEREVPNE